MASSLKGNSLREKSLSKISLKPMYQQVIFLFAKSEIVPIVQLVQVTIFMDAGFHKSKNMYDTGLAG